MATKKCPICAIEFSIGVPPACGHMSFATPDPSGGVMHFTVSGDDCKCPPFTAENYINNIKFVGETLLKSGNNMIQCSAKVCRYKSSKERFEIFRGKPEPQQYVNIPLSPLMPPPEAMDNAVALLTQVLFVPDGYTPYSLAASAENVRDASTTNTKISTDLSRKCPICHEKLGMALSHPACEYKAIKDLPKMDDLFYLPNFAAGARVLDNTIIPKPDANLREINDRFAPPPAANTCPICRASPDICICELLEFKMQPLMPVPTAAKSADIAAELQAQIDAAIKSATGSVEYATTPDKSFLPNFTAIPDSAKINAFDSAIGSLVSENHIPADMLAMFAANEEGDNTVAKVAAIDAAMAAFISAALRAEIDGDDFHPPQPATKRSGERTLPATIPPRDFHDIFVERAAPLPPRNLDSLGKERAVRFDTHTGPIPPVASSQRDTALCRRCSGTLPDSCTCTHISDYEADPRMIPTPDAESSAAASNKPIAAETPLEIAGFNCSDKPTFRELKARQEKVAAAFAELVADAQQRLDDAATTLKIADLSALTLTQLFAAVARYNIMTEFAPDNAGIHHVAGRADHDTVKVTFMTANSRCANKAQDAFTMLAAYLVDEGRATAADIDGAQRERNLRRIMEGNPEFAVPAEVDDEMRAAFVAYIAANKIKFAHNRRRGMSYNDCIKYDRITGWLRENDAECAAAKDAECAKQRQVELTRKIIQHNAITYMTRRRISPHQIAAMKARIIAGGSSPIQQPVTSAHPPTVFAKLERSDTRGILQALLDQQELDVAAARNVLAIIDRDKGPWTSGYFERHICDKLRKRLAEHEPATAAAETVAEPVAVQHRPTGAASGHIIAIKRRELREQFAAKQRALLEEFAAEDRKIVAAVPTPPNARRYPRTAAGIARYRRDCVAYVVARRRATAPVGPVVAEVAAAIIPEPVAEIAAEEPQISPEFSEYLQWDQSASQWTTSAAEIDLTTLEPAAELEAEPEPSSPPTPPQQDPDYVMVDMSQKLMDSLLRFGDNIPTPPESEPASPIATRIVATVEEIVASEPLPVAPSSASPPQFAPHSTAKERDEVRGPRMSEGTAGVAASNSSLTPQSEQSLLLKLLEEMSAMRAEMSAMKARQITA